MNVRHEYDDDGEDDGGDDDEEDDDGGRVSLNCILNTLEFRQCMDPVFPIACL